METLLKIMQYNCLRFKVWYSKDISKTNRQQVVKPKVSQCMSGTNSYTYRKRRHMTIAATSLIWISVRSSNVSVLSFVKELAGLFVGLAVVEGHIHSKLACRIPEVIRTMVYLKDLTHLFQNDYCMQYSWSDVQQLRSATWHVQLAWLQNRLYLTEALNHLICLTNHMFMRFVRQ